MVSLKFIEEQPQILRLTTPELKDVRDPVPHPCDEDLSPGTPFAQNDSQFCVAHLRLRTLDCTCANRDRCFSMGLPDTLPTSTFGADYTMKQALLILLLAAGVAAAAQTPAKPAAPATAAHHAATTPAGSATKLPPGVPVVRGIVKSAFTLRYEDIKLGTGADAEPNKMYKVFYTGYLGLNGRPDDGHKFDSSDDHRPPLKDKDGKPVMGDDGKPKLGDPQPMAFPQGMGRLIPGFDQGFVGMKIGGKRRLFIPWQLAYGARGRPGPDAAHPGIPTKADLIFDVELVDISEMAAPGGPGGMGRPQGGRPGGPPGAVPPGAMPRPFTPTPGMPATPGSSATPGAPAAAATPGAAPAPGAPPATPPAAPPAASATTPAPTTPAQPQAH